MSVDGVGAAPAVGLWDDILEVARWTPSPHNTQPWKIGSGDGERVLYLDALRALPDEDVTGCFVVAALGMFVETVSIAAANRGHRLDIVLADLESVRKAASGQAGERSVRVAEMRLTERPDVAPLFSDDVVLARRTSRLAPSSAPIPDEALSALEGEARTGGLEASLIEDGDRVAELMSLNLAAVVEDLNTPRYRDEIAGWFRYTRKQEERTSDGLSARCMGMPGYEMAFLARFAWLARWPIIGGLVRRQYRRRLGPVPRLMALAGPFWEARNSFDAGRALMRFWLTATRHGLSIHPFGNLITNARAAEAVKTLTGIEHPWIIFRIGFTQDPPRSRRLSLDRLLIADE